MKAGLQFHLILDPEDTHIQALKLSRVGMLMEKSTKMAWIENFFTITKMNKRNFINKCPKLRLTGTSYRNLHQLASLYTSLNCININHFNCSSMSKFRLYNTTLNIPAYLSLSKLLLCFSFFKHGMKFQFTGKPKTLQLFL